MQIKNVWGLFFVGSLLVFWFFWFGCCCWFFFFLSEQCSYLLCKCHLPSLRSNSLQSFHFLKHIDKFLGLVNCSHLARAFLFWNEGLEGAFQINIGNQWLFKLSVSKVIKNYWFFFICVVGFFRNHNTMPILKTHIRRVGILQQHLIQNRSHCSAADLLFITGTLTGFLLFSKPTIIKDQISGKRGF